MLTHFLKITIRNLAIQNGQLLRFFCCDAIYEMQN